MLFLKIKMWEGGKLSKTMCISELLVDKMPRYNLRGPQGEGEDVELEDHGEGPVGGPTTPEPEGQVAGPARRSITRPTFYRQFRRTIEHLTAKVQSLESRLAERTRSEAQHVTTEPSCGTLAVCPVIDVRTDRPRYPGKYGIHPVSFIEDLSSYLRRLPNKELTIDNIIGCLEGDIRKWARIYKDRWANEDDFKHDFLDAYWGEAEQNELRRAIVNGTWDREENKTMVGHFVSLVGQAKMMTRPLPEWQIVDDLLRHFPRKVQYTWRMRRPPSSSRS